MDFRQLRYFTAIYEQGTLSGAASQARVAVSALSHSLANLESGLSSKLFYRKPRGMQPTAAGERIYVHARSILKAVSAAERDIRESGGEVTGEISAGLAHSAVRAIGVPLMKKVLESYPELQLSLTESLSGPTLTHLTSADVDLALVFNPPADPLLKILPVLEEKLICVGLPEIIGDTDDPISFDEMIELPIILLRQGPSTRALFDDVGTMKKLEAKARLQLNSIYAITGSLLAGLGCTVGTNLIMHEQLENGFLHFRHIIEPELSRTLCMCEMADRPATFAFETVRTLILELIDDAHTSGQWGATTLVNSPKLAS